MLKLLFNILTLCSPPGCCAANSLVGIIFVLLLSCSQWMCSSSRAKDPMELSAWIQKGLGAFDPCHKSSLLVGWEFF